MKKFALIALGGVAGFGLALGVLPQAHGANEMNAYRQLDLFSDAFERVRANYVRPVQDSELVSAAMATFFEVREIPGLKKKPSTSELIDWLKLLMAEEIGPEALRSADNKLAIPPLAGALLKNEQDMHLFERLVFMNRANR